MPERFTVVAIYDSGPAPDDAIAHESMTAFAQRILRSISRAEAETHGRGALE
jgi:hypothetical protein